MEDQVLRSPSAAGGARASGRAGRLRRAVTAVAVGWAAWTTGAAAAIGTATVTPRPAAFLTAGLLVTGLVATPGLWWAFRRNPRGLRLRATVVGVGALLLVWSLALTVPLPDPRSDPPSVTGLAHWELDDGSRLAHVHRRGEAPRRELPVVVLHGGPGVPDMAGDVALYGRLAELGYDVHVYDQVGAGRSTRLADVTGYGIDRDVADLEQIRRTIGAEQMILVGHSYGGQLAAHYLAEHPGRVAKLVLTSPGALDPLDRSGDGALSRLGAAATLRTLAAALAPRALMGYALTQVAPDAAHAYLGDDEADARSDRILSLVEPALHCSPEQSGGPVRGSGYYAWQYPQSATAPPRRDVRPELQGLPTPTLVVKGECDYLSWRSAAEYLRVLPNATLVHVEDAGHDVHRDRPEDVLAVVRAFLDGAPLPMPAYTADVAPEGYSGPP